MRKICKWVYTLETWNVYDEFFQTTVVLRNGNFDLNKIYRILIKTMLLRDIFIDYHFFFYIVVFSVKTCITSNSDLYVLITCIQRKHEIKAAGQSAPTKMASRVNWYLCVYLYPVYSPAV